MANALSRFPVGRMRACAHPRRTGDADVIEDCSRWHLRVQHFVNSVVRSQIPYGEGIGEQVALMARVRRWEYSQEQIRSHAEGGSTLMISSCISGTDVNHPIHNGGRGVPPPRLYQNSIAWRPCRRSAHRHSRSRSRYRPHRSPRQARKTPKQCAGAGVQCIHRVSRK